MKYKLKTANLNEWDKFVKSVDCRSLFMNSTFFSNATPYFWPLLFYKGSNPRAGLLLVCDESYTKVFPDGLIIHSGLVFAENASQKLINARTERFEITQQAAEWLEASFDHACLKFLPEIKDIRPFQWVNYHREASARRYHIRVRYTSEIDISELMLKKPFEKTKLFDTFDARKQKDIKDAYADGLRVTRDVTPEEFVMLYKTHMEERGEDVTKQNAQRIRALCNVLIEEGLGSFFGIRTHNNQLSYVTFFSCFNNHSYYLYAAGDRYSMGRNYATYCIWEAFQWLSSRGVTHVDMEGVNSPSRGGYKLGFGGQLIAYFEVSV